MPEQLSKRLIADYKLNKKLAKQVLDSEYLELFETLAKETKVSSITIAVTLTETLKALKRDNVEVESVSDAQFRNMFALLDQGKTAKESVPEILTWLAKNTDSTVEDALESLGLSMLSSSELGSLIDGVIEKNRELIESRGKGALGALMGTIMKKARGRAEAKLINDILKKKLEQKMVK
jgi:glutamyl-tRNA(Gln) amidotransferase subunit E